jgi:hypothetical protein
MTEPDVDRLAELLRALPPAPQGWVQAAQELPLARKTMDELVSRAVADAQFRQALLEDLEGALAAEGYEPRPALVAELRHRLRAE